MVKSSAVKYALLSVVLAAAGLAAFNSRKHSSFTPRFEVEVFTQGDTIMDPVTHKLFDEETATAKAARIVEVHFVDSREVLESRFMVPPWHGERGQTLESGMHGREEITGRFFSGCGAKLGSPQPWPGPVTYNAGTFVHGEDPLGGPKEPSGRYLLQSPRNAEVILTSQQSYLDYPRIASVTGDDAKGYTVKWKPVKGALGYAISTYGTSAASTTCWANSNRDWREMGAKQALEQGVLLRETTCVIPGGMYGEPFRVSVDAIAPDTRSQKADIISLGYAHSQKTIEVNPDRGGLPPDPSLELEDPDKDMRPSDPFRAAIFDGDLKSVAAMATGKPALVNQQFDVINPLMMAFLRKRHSIAKYLIEHGANVNLPDLDGQTPLDFACCFDATPELIELLLRKGAHIEGTPGDETPLHQATRSGSVEIVQVLLKHGAKVNSVDADGRTPLDYAGMYERDRTPEIVALLKSRGARISPPRPAPAPCPTPKSYHKFPAPDRDQVLATLKSAASVQLYSVDPEDFRYRKVLGKTVLNGPEKDELVQQFEQGIRNSDGMEAACFNPRHAIIVQNGKDAFCFLICYECLQIYVNRLDPREGYDPNGDYGESLKLLTTGEPATIFNQALTLRKVPLPQH